MFKEIRCVYGHNLHVNTASWTVFLFYSFTYCIPLTWQVCCFTPSGMCSFCFNVFYYNDVSMYATSCVNYTVWNGKYQWMNIFIAQFSEFFQYRTVLLVVSNWILYMRFEVSMAVKMSLFFFWVVMLCWLLSRNQCFGGIYCL
jgi:hypothetical protein